MGDTAIEWTDKTWNPIRGCSRVSEGCRNCYAERVAARFSGPGQPYDGLAKMTTAGPRWTGEVRVIEKHLYDPIRWRKPRRIFVNSMSDLFHEKVSDADLLRIFAVMAASQPHTFQVLTKRPARMAEFANSIPTPLPNVWLGVSVEDQKAAAERIPLLAITRAAVRFLSCEPLLGPIDLSRVRITAARTLDYRPALHWVIVGGESGPRARPMEAEWAQALREQCLDAGVAFFFKQGSSNNWPRYKDVESFPVGLRVREYPAGAP